MYSSVVCSITVVDSLLMSVCRLTYQMLCSCLIVPIVKLAIVPTGGHFLLKSVPVCSVICWSALMVVVDVPRAPVTPGSPRCAGKPPPEPARPIAARRMLCLPGAWVLLAPGTQQKMLDGVGECTTLGAQARLSAVQAVFVGV